MGSPKGATFWRQALTFQGSITPLVALDVLAFGLIAGALALAADPIETALGVRVAVEVAPWEIGGAVLGLLLVFRTNAGYDRWWEGRKLWGGIVNQSRNLAIDALAYGPADAPWREQTVRWAASFAHVAKSSLRGEQPSAAVVELLGSKAAEEIAAAPHMPSYVALRLGGLLRRAYDSKELEPFAFMQIDRERALLIDHIGACERILKTPLPLVYSIKIRRFIVLFLLTLPFTLLHRIGQAWLVPVITMLVAYPLLSLDRIGIELENPFSPKNHSHLPLDDIAATIERNLMGLLKLKESEMITGG
jgi:putative membrane protein